MPSRTLLQLHPTTFAKVWSLCHLQKTPRTFIGKCHFPLAFNGWVEVSGKIAETIPVEPTEKENPLDSVALDLLSKLQEGAYSIIEGN